MQTVNQCDQHRRNADAIQGAETSAASAYNERQARAWSDLACASIKRGHFGTAINQLQHALGLTAYSNYSGQDFSA